MPGEAPSAECRGRGALVGALVGDALGAPWEGESSATIARTVASLAAASLSPHPAEDGPCWMADSRVFPDAVASAEVAGIDLMARPSAVGMHTDDGEQTIGLARSLVAVRGVDAEHAALSAAMVFVCPPDHGGYSAHTFAKLCALAQGKVDFRTLGSMHDDWLRDKAGAAPASSDGTSGVGAAGSGGASKSIGSYGNGGAMRVAPVGLAYRSLADDAEAMRAVVSDAISVTHTHVEAIDAATVVALAVARTMTDHASVRGGGVLFLQGLVDACATDEMRSRLKGCVEALSPGFVAPEDVEGSGMSDSADTPTFCKADKRVLQHLCTPGKWFQIRAVDAVAYVLFVVAKYGGLDRIGTAAGSVAARHAMVRMVSLGGDTDTLASMVGAILGAAHGDTWIPKEWLDSMEQDERTGWPAAARLGAEVAIIDPKSEKLDAKEIAPLVSALRDSLKAMPLPIRHAGF